MQRTAVLCLLLAGCLSRPPGPGAEDDAGVVDPGDAGDPQSPCGDELRHGNRLSYSFEQSLATRVAFDRSTWRFDASMYGAAQVEGAHGLGLDHKADTETKIPDQDELDLGNRLTIEAWIRPDTAGAMTIFSDFDQQSDEPDEVEMHLALDGDGRLLFRSNIDGSIVERVSPLVFEPGDLAHAAVTWDGQLLRFYRDGVLGAASSLEGSPRLQAAALHVGSVHDGDDEPFIGLIDEVRVSNCPKTQAQIADSMDSAEGVACGDYLIEDPEACDADNLCCTSECEVRTSGPCDDVNGTCTESGACQLQAAALRPAGALAVYEFDETSGQVAADSAGSLDLTVLAGAWQDGTLVLAGGARAESATASAIVAACQASEEVSVDAWIEAAAITNEGLIAGVSPTDIENTSPSVALFQIGSWYGAAVTSSRSDDLGGPALVSREGDVQTALRHVVITRTSDGERRLYIDSVIRGHNHVPGDFDTWDDQARILVGGVINSTAAEWSGAIGRLAIYCRALSHAEVIDSYTVGAD